MRAQRDDGLGIRSEIIQNYSQDAVPGIFGGTMEIFFRSTYSSDAVGMRTGISLDLSGHSRLSKKARVRCRDTTIASINDHVKAGNRFPSVMRTP